MKPDKVRGPIAPRWALSCKSGQGQVARRSRRPPPQSAEICRVPAAGCCHVARCSSDLLLLQSIPGPTPLELATNLRIYAPVSIGVCTNLVRTVAFRNIYCNFALFSSCWGCIVAIVLQNAMVRTKLVHTPMCFLMASVFKKATRDTTNGIPR